MKTFNFKKKFGQNFLIDKNIINKIVNSTDIDKDSLVIEVGAGSGNLTKEICKKAGFVLCYEIDLEVEDLLLENLETFNNYKLVIDDFLKRNILGDIVSCEFDYKKIYVIANLPYYITTPIIEKIIDSKLVTKDIVIMIQKEVADRFCASTGNKNYGSISVYLNYYYNLNKLFLVTRKCFSPPPNIDSMVIKLNYKANKIKVDNEEILFKLIKDSFRYKRKNLKNNLITYNLKFVEEVLIKYGYNLNTRAEQLSIEIFCDIANKISI